METKKDVFDILHEKYPGIDLLYVSRIKNRLIQQGACCICGKNGNNHYVAGRVGPIAVHGVRCLCAKHGTLFKESIYEEWLKEYPLIPLDLEEYTGERRFDHPLIARIEEGRP